MPFGQASIRGFAQYAFSLAMAIPVIALALGLSALSVGYAEFVESMTASATTLQSWGTIALATPEYVAVALSVVYALGAITYTPRTRDRSDLYRVDKKTATAPYQWERLLGILSVAIFPAVMFAVLYTGWDPSFIQITETTAFALGFAAHLVLAVPALKFYKIRYITGNHNHVAVKYGLYELSVLTTVVLAAFPFGYANYLPISGGAMEVSFLVFVLFMLLAARRFRYMLYKDDAGFKRLSPNIPVWISLSRVPLLIPVYMLVVGAGASNIAIVGAFTTFVAGVGYIIWRGSQGAGAFEHPKGGLGRGSDYYEKTVRKPNREAAKNGDGPWGLSEAVREFNSFARTNGFETIPSTKSAKFSENAVKATFDRIESNTTDADSVEEHLDELVEEGVDAGRIPADVFKAYVRHRDVVLEKFD
ncbi:hypothetical protein [Salinarchaeum laminariae]|uniref:hypothetical protein n=1 Tax=Salinarchaeum laminariae TaxID=869888 RepID=UPI0020BEAC6B|nr:hypothetical protein [Salinarchaeum laminariae]